MSMTREEAIELVCYGDWLNILMSHLGDDDINRLAEAMCIIGNTLRPVSREVVERIWPGCDYCKHAWMEGLDLKPCASGNIGVELTIGRTSKDDAFGILAYYRNTAAGYIDLPFCPFCGRPMTDEAVQMVMERLEALKDAD